MARISTQTNEQVFSVTGWLGVNEAQEGQARLRVGEAAVMRNFRITSGGALKKRGGSEKVAGLTQRYVPVTDSEGTLTRTDIGLPDAWPEMYRSVTTDSVGNIVPDGEATLVTPDNHESYMRNDELSQGGYFAFPGGKAGEFCGFSRTPGTGDTRIPGGAYAKGKLVRLAQGQESDLSGKNIVSGTQRVEVFPVLSLPKGEVTLSGEGRTYEKPAGEAEGWTEENAGGFVLLRSGALYAFYGTKLEVDMTLRWHLKYACTKTGENSYTIGTKVLATPLVRVGERPQADLGLIFEAEYGGYTVMRDGTAYYAFCPDPDRPQEHRVRNYSWWGYPITVSADVTKWYFHPVTAVATDAEDTEVRALWSGYVGESEVLCAACNGYLCQMQRSDEGHWSKTNIGAIDTSGNVTMFGFDKKLYVLDGQDYKVWDGAGFASVGGYRPLVLVSVSADGAGQTLEQVNKLSGARRCHYSPDGSAKDFHLPEGNVSSLDFVRDLSTGTDYMLGTDYSYDGGVIRFTAAPPEGVNTLDVGYTVSENDAASVRKMRFAELYNGAQDTRVFLYGDGSANALYSGIDQNGRARADYFPDLNVCAVGDANTPITAMIRHYNKLLAFKEDSAWSIRYDTLTLSGGSVTAGFYVTPVHRSIGNCAPGQALLVENAPRTLDARSVISWQAGTASLTGDERSAQRISQRVDRTIRGFDLRKARTFYNKHSHEYYVIGDTGLTLVHGVDCDAWYIYTDFDARCLIRYKDELYFGTSTGWLMHMREDCYSDDGRAIDCYWESGAMPFARDFMRKYSAMLWVGIKPEAKGYLEVSAETDRKRDFAVYSFRTDDAHAVPTMHRIKLKAKKFTHYKLILSSNTSDSTATVVSADLRVRQTGYGK
ncbi:MAG: hypothetical protein IKK78_04690 [Oscillospiraceae bacterium]|nr:hypothetical protein [Oscillospiraceae bacterium]